MQRSDHEGRFMALVKMCMVSMVFSGILFGFYAAKWLAGFIGFIWLAFVISAAGLVLSDIKRRRQMRFVASKDRSEKELLECRRG